MSAGPAADAGQSLSLTVTSDNPSLFTAVPSVAADGTLTYTPGSIAGSAIVTVVAADNGGTAFGGRDRVTNTFRITVVPANLVVSSTADSGPGSLRDVIANANMAGLSVTILFAPGAGITPLTPLPAFTGPVTLAGSGTLPPLSVGPGGTLDLGGGNFAGTGIAVGNGGTLAGNGSFSGALTVAPGGTVAPGASPGQMLLGSGTGSGAASYVWELKDATGLAGTGWDFLNYSGELALAATSADPFTVQVRTLTSENASGPMANFDNTRSYAWTIASAGSLSGFDLAALRLDTNQVANAPGTGRFALRLSGNNVQVTFTPNTAPTVNPTLPPVTVAEDAAAVPVALANHFSDAEQPAAELTYALTGNSMPQLVTATLGTGGAVTLAFAPDQYGSATLTFSATDAGGLFAVTTLAVTVTPVNDAPDVTFRFHTDVPRNAGAQSFPGFATFSPGPANEAAQALVSYTVTVDNSALFSSTPALANNGTLTFTPASDAIGSTRVTVVVQDNGGTGLTTAGLRPQTALPDGVDKRTNTFTITIYPVNRAPVTVLDAFSLDQGGVLLVAAADGVLRNDSDPDGDTLTAQLLSGPSNGQVQLSPDGSFIYIPTPGFSGTDAFALEVHDGTIGTASTVFLQVQARPTSTVPGGQEAVAGLPLRFASTNTPANGLTVDDTDSPDLTVTLAVERGLLAVQELPGLTFIGGQTNGTNLTFSGPVALLNAALETLTYTAFTNQLGDDTLLLVATDEGGRVNLENFAVPLQVLLAPLGVPSLSLDALNTPARTITNVTALVLDTSLVQGITFDPASNVINVLPVGGQDGSTNRTSITVRVQFSDGTEQDVVVPVIIYQPLLTSVAGDATYSGTFGTPLFNPQTSLYEQKVSVQNNTPFDFMALRITATNLPAGVTLRNASITNGGFAYIEYQLPVRSGSNVTLTLEYYTANRATPVTPGLKLELLNSTRAIAPPSNPVMTEVLGRRGYAPDGRIRFYIEFPTTVGLNYYIQYKDAISDPWKTSPVVISGTGNRLNWLDDGAPNTDSPPTAGRFYRVVTGQ